jgi:Chaperone of endosialidase
MYLSRKQLEYLGEPIGNSHDIVLGHDRKYYGGGKGGADAPDYTAVAAASEKAAILGAELGNKQLAESQRQYDNNMAVAAPIVAAQAGLSNQQIAQGNDYFNYMKSYSRPVEQSLFYESMGFTPDEIQQIEASRTGETAAFNANAQIPVASTFTIPTSTLQQDIPTGAVKGSAVGTVQITKPNPNQNPGGMAGIGWQPTITQTVKADPNAYYVKGANGQYTQVQVGQKVIEGTKTVTANVPQDTSRLIQQTPETDALTAKLGAVASARQKATDATARAELIGLNTNLANRIGESDVDTYYRNKTAIDAETDAAVADSRAGFTNTSNNIIRQGLRYGMSPEKIAAAQANIGTTQATQLASAANNTRKSATQTMYQRGIGQSDQLLKGGLTERSNKIQDESINTAKKLDVAGLYRGLPGASQGAYGLSLNAGNSAVSNNAQAGQQLLQGNQIGANTIMQGTQQQLQGLTGILNSQTSIANSNAGSGDSIWGALGQVGGAYVGSLSDEKVKKDVKKVDDAESLKGIKQLDVKKWKYDPKKVKDKDSNEHIGAMAQDMEKNLGKQVSNGHMIDLISAVGITMSATKALAKEVDKLKGKK